MMVKTIGIGVSEKNGIRALIDSKFFMDHAECVGESDGGVQSPSSVSCASRYLSVKVS